MVWLIGLCGSIQLNASGPILPGLFGGHPLSAGEKGVLLISELGCAACHAFKRAEWFAPKPSPDLSDVGNRLRPDFLIEFLRTPLQTQHGTTMPALLDRLAPLERKDAALALTHFLMSQRDQAEAESDPNQTNPEMGRELFRSIGCLACHGPDPLSSGADAGFLGLNHVSSKYRFKSLASFLFNPLKVRPGGRMPDMKLSREEASALASFLIENEPIPETDFHVDPVLAFRGSRYYQELNCHACHPLEGVPEGATRIPILGDPGDKGCLNGQVDGFQGAKYALSSDQQRFIRAALDEVFDPATDLDRVELTMTRFNCIACHQRDGYGGVGAAAEDYFQTEEPELGRESRIPPDLSKLGARLKPNVIRKVLFDGQVYRPYMRTRMPQFGESNLRFFVEALLAVDAGEGMDFDEVAREEEGKMREIGHLLVGDQGMNCIACHNVNGLESPGFHGIDLMAAYERLQPGWFYRYLLNPNEYRPGIVMPAYWPEGESVRQDILEGDTDAQIKAIWHYLSLGTSAQIPSGMRRERTTLSVKDKARVYRGRSNVAGFRGIAVGFPSGVHLALDARAGSLAAVWKGDFVSVNWAGQGAGDFNPLNRPLVFERDLGFYRLESDSAPWPKRPITTKEHPVNPDPDYPRNLGYRFKGYSLDSNGVPTFYYRVGDLEIEDRFMGMMNEGKAVLDRRLVFLSSKDDSIAIRALTGPLNQQASNVYRTGELRLSFDDCEPVLRPIEAGGGSSELLLNIPTPKGRSSFTLRYEF